MILFSQLTHLLYLVDPKTGKKKGTLNTHDILNTTFDMLSLKHKVPKKELNIHVDESGEIQVTRCKGNDFQPLEIIPRK